MPLSEENAEYLVVSMDEEFRPLPDPLYLEVIVRLKKEKKKQDFLATAVMLLYIRII